MIAQNLTFKRVLVALDFGADSLDVLKQASLLAKDGKLAVCHVMPDLTRVRPLLPHVQSDDLTAALGLEVRVRDELDRLLGEAEIAKADVFLEYGAPYAAITTIAKSWKADLVVVGSPHAGRSWLGGTSERVARHASTPVLVARKSGAGPVLAATDLSDPARPALMAAAELGKQLQSEVVVVHVVDVGTELAVLSAASAFSPSAAGAAMRMKDLVDSARMLLEGAVTPLLPQATREVLEGPAAHTLVQRARELDAKLIVIATRGRTGFDRVLVGSVAESVLAESSSPVLVVRHQDSDE